MYKLLTILFFSLLFSGTSFADSHCTDERKAWVEYFKVDFAKNFEEVIYTDEKCWSHIKSYKLGGEKYKIPEFKEAKKDSPEYDFWGLLSDRNSNINWVPEYFEIDANEDYVYGAHYFHKNEYENAAIFLADFIDNNSQHRLVPKAKFLYAETFRLTEEYIDAAIEYVDIYEKFNKSEFRPISLLRIGEMTIKIGFKEKGCEVLNHFQYEFPLIKEEIYVESENLLKQYQCPKIVITDSKILLSKILKDTRELIK